MPHQVKALEYTKNRNRIALFMEMRLGKTMVAIRWDEMNRSKRTLVVAPLTVLRVWEEELLKEEWAEEDIVTIRGSLKKRVELAHKEARWYLVNYEALLVTPELICEEYEFDCIILDESTKIRSPQARITKLLNQPSNHPRKAILSGCPAPESVLDYFEQMRFLFGRFLNCNNYWQFRARNFRQVGYEWVPFKTTRLNLHYALDKEVFFMSRKQAGIDTKKIFEKRFVPMNAEQLKLTKQIKAGFAFETPAGDRVETKWVPVQYIWWARIAGGFSPDGRQISDAKCAEVRQIIEQLPEGEPVVVWFRFEEELQATVKFLRRNKYDVGVHNGENQKDAKRFEDGELRIICAQARCGQYALNWSRSSTAIYYSNWYDGEVRIQSEDRIIHPKKRDPLLYIDLVAEGSIDEEVVSMLKMKKFNSKEFASELKKRWELRNVKTT